MLPLFSAATDENVCDFVSRLRTKLKDKFNVVIGQSKLLHTIAELNGFRNWQSMKTDLESPRKPRRWLVTCQSVDQWPVTAIAPDLPSALSAFLHLIETVVRLMPDHVKWDVLGHDEDAAFTGLFLRLNGEVFASITRAFEYSGIETVEPIDNDLSHLAGVCQSTIADIGKEVDAEARHAASQNTIYAKWVTRHTYEFINSNGARDLVPNTDSVNELVSSLKDAKQYIEFTATVQGE